MRTPGQVGVVAQEMLFHLDPRNSEAHERSSLVFKG